MVLIKIKIFQEYNFLLHNFLYNIYNLYEYIFFNLIIILQYDLSFKRLERLSGMGKNDKFLISGLEKWSVFCKISYKIIKLHSVDTEISKGGSR